MKLLLADDNGMYRELFSHVLREKGYEADHVSSKAQLVESARNGVYDAIITKYNMPRGREGLDALIEIREFDADVPVVIYSDRFEDEEFGAMLIAQVLATAKKYGNVRVLTKTVVKQRVNSGHIDELFA